jgi:DNA-binding XRE family transcriptional regulator
VSKAAACLAYVADEYERELERAVAPPEALDHFWERPHGLELELASFDPEQEEFDVWFKAGPRYRLPARALQEAGAVVAVELDDYRHGVIVAFSDGRATSFASDLVLFECEPEYRASVAMTPERPAGATLRALRIASGRTAADVAAAAGMAPPNYARIEAGHHRPRVDTLVRIAAALGVPLARLFQGPG